MSAYPYPKMLFGDWCYRPVDPQGDTTELARKDRLVLYHDLKTGPKLFIAAAGTCVAGWVVGVAA